MILGLRHAELNYANITHPRPQHSPLSALCVFSVLAREFCDEDWPLTERRASMRYGADLSRLGKSLLECHPHIVKVYN